MKTYTPRQLEAVQLTRWFSAKSTPTDSQNRALEEIRGWAQHMADTVLRAAPGGPDQTVAVRKIREAVMMCEEAILREPLPVHAVVHPAVREAAAKDVRDAEDREIHGKAADEDGVRLKL